jgi:hypothetical protein
MDLLPTDAEPVVEILGEAVEEEARVAEAPGTGEAAAGEGRVEQGGGSIHQRADGICGRVAPPSPRTVS